MMIIIIIYRDLPIIYIQYMNFWEKLYATYNTVINI